MESSLSQVVMWWVFCRGGTLVDEVEVGENREGPYETVWARRGA